MAGPSAGDPTSAYIITRRKGRGRWSGMHAMTGSWVVADDNRIERTFDSQAEAEAYRKRTDASSQTSKARKPIVIGKRVV